MSPRTGLLIVELGQCVRGQIRDPVINGDFSFKGDSRSKTPLSGFQRLFLGADTVAITLFPA